jgi:hypothetical protein
MKGAEIYRQSTAKCGQNCLPQRNVFEWIGMFKSSRTGVVDAGRWGRPSTSTSEQNLERAQAMILENCWVTITKIAARLGINVARPWCKLLVLQSSLRYTHKEQMHYNWTTLAACHCMTLSYSMTGPQQRCHSYNENIPILPLPSPSYIYNFSSKIWREAISGET